MTLVLLLLIWGTKAKPNTGTNSEPSINAKMWYQHLKKLFNSHQHLFFLAFCVHDCLLIFFKFPMLIYRAPCVIFIDEIDSVGSKRTSSVLHPYANQTINQVHWHAILTEHMCFNYE